MVRGMVIKYDVRVRLSRLKPLPQVRGLRRSYKRRVDHHTHLIFLKNAHNATLATTINPSAKA